MLPGWVGGTLTAGSGTPTSSSAHLPFLLEDRLHPGDLEDPRRGRVGQKGQELVGSEALPAIRPPSPTLSLIRAPTGF